MNFYDRNAYFFHSVTDWVSQNNIFFNQMKIKY
jgi:hypothetical protein